MGMRRRALLLGLTFAVAVLVLAGALAVLAPSGAAPSAGEGARSGVVTLREAYREHRSGLQVEARGEVIRLLPDDDDGSRHQRFILRLSSGQTVLIAHNIDLAPRLEGLQAGDKVGFFGEYEWNPEGGVVHWTHHDPGGDHPGGWLEYQGRRYH
ncbi:uncharacterized protein DUF3465 [Chromohalobacter marismortui]|uniref:Uncharacterized protein DUF3465 n=1 Tax=Chromohalobacter marismortui TaxID=42055 RepID=A0A4R7NJ23_9GAMM|nr:MULTISPECIES: DUF3465 domain-containing protein [Chromohalobacter]MCI0511507.1 DUF3465 domain-containing protein [Chromohalobacter sp.]MCI0594432.1 DUF3465 domain-containing protein [Chromohalobacter sp.]TDU20448.1 uncharacterized protein DUF3465 [Chromohalobacter marismortui]